MTKKMKLKMPKKKAPLEKRTATAYAYIKPTNKLWLEAQAKSMGVKLSPALDYLLDQLRESNPK